MSHYRKDGGLDMRYSSSKAAVSSGSSSSGGSGSGGGGGGGSSTSSSRSSGGSYGGSYGGSSHSAGNSCASNTSNSQGMHHKKDGSLDMRYSSSKLAAAGGSNSSGGSSGGSVGYSSGGSPQSAAIRSSPAEGLHCKKDGTLDMSTSTALQAYPSVDLHSKKDGTPDMRFNSSKAAVATGSSRGISNHPNAENLHYNKDGTLDMRFKSSRDALAWTKSPPPQSGSPAIADIPLKKDGRPDMRHKGAKEWVASEVDKCVSNGIEPWFLKKKKDGTWNLSDPCTAAAAKQLNVDQNAEDVRRKYYDNRLKDPKFRKEWQEAQRGDVEMGSPCIFPVPPYHPQTASPYPPTSGPASIIPMLSSLLSGRGLSDPSNDWQQQIDRSVPQIDIKLLGIDEGRELGRGAFGVVYKGSYNGLEVAVKQLHTALNKRDSAAFVKEINVLAMLGSHPNLIKLHGYSLDPASIVMEFADLGNVHYLLYDCTEPAVEARMADGRIKKKIAFGIVNALNQLARAGIIHGDVKPQNVLVMKDYTAKLCDFGLAALRAKTASTTASNKTNDEEMTGVGTPAYMAPELLTFVGDASSKTDVYSFGILLNELITEQEPYQDQYTRFLGRGPYAAAQFASSGNRPQMASNVPLSLRTLIQRCWHADPRQRPPLETILESFVSDASLIFPDSSFLDSA